MAGMRKDNRNRTLKVGESQRPDGSYQYRYTNILGKRECIRSWRLVPSDKTPPGKKETLSLREQEKEIEMMNASGMSSVGMQFTLNDMFDRYITTKKYKGRKLSDNTRTNYKLEWDKNIRNDILGNMKIVNIKKNDIVFLYTRLMDENGLSYGTVKFFNKLLSGIFNMAIDNDIIKRNPTARVLDEIEGCQQEREAITKEQQDELLKYLNVYDRDMYKKVVFLLDTMCRLSEFAGLTWEDIDMKNKTIKIDHQLKYLKFDGDEKYQYHITPTKNRKERVIPMTDRVYKIMRELKTYYFINQSDYVVDGKTNFIFYSKRKRLLNDVVMNNALKDTLRLFNKTAENTIEHLTCHILRHTGCTRNAEDGMDIKVLQYLMGHASSKITNDVYNHVTEERAKKELINIGKSRCDAV